MKHGVKHGVKHVKVSVSLWRSWCEEGVHLAGFLTSVLAQRFGSISEATAQPSRDNKLGDRLMSCDGKKH